MGKKPVGRGEWHIPKMQAKTQGYFYDLVPGSEFFSGKISPFCEEE